jgi:hypothetical protein
VVSRTSRAAHIQFTRSSARGAMWWHHPLGGVGWCHDKPPTRQPHTVLHTVAAASTNRPRGTAVSRQHRSGYPQRLGMAGVPTTGLASPRKLSHSKGAPSACAGAASHTSQDQGWRRLGRIPRSLSPAYCRGE